MKKVVFMGTPDFASGILLALIDAQYEVTAVFTQPDKPKGRGKSLQMSPVKETALKYGIEVFQPQKIREPENTELLKKMAPDFIVVAAFGQIIPQSILDIPEYGCLNVHASLLPAWRGAAPIQWSIISGDQETGVTIMRMNAGLDTGDIISKAAIRIDENETGGSLFDRLMPVGADLLIRTMKEIEEGRATYTPQPEKSTTPYASQLSKKSGLIDWTMDAASIERRIRGLSPWPGAFTFEHGKMLKIWRTREVKDSQNLHSKSASSGVSSDDSKGEGTAPGTIVSVTGKELLVRTGDGILSLLEVQPEGKKRMEIDAFLRGYQQKAGDFFRSDRSD